MANIITTPIAIVVRMGDITTCEEQVALAGLIEAYMLDTAIEVVVFDLATTRELNEHGIAVLMGAVVHANRRGGVRVCIGGHSRPAQCVVHLARLYKVLRVFPSPEEAIVGAVPQTA